MPPQYIESVKSLKSRNGHRCRNPRHNTTFELCQFLWPPVTNWTWSNPHNIMYFSACFFLFFLAHKQNLPKLDINRKGPNKQRRKKETRLLQAYSPFMNQYVLSYDFHMALDSWVHLTQHLLYLKITNWRNWQWLRRKVPSKMKRFTNIYLYPWRRNLASCTAMRWWRQTGAHSATINFRSKDNILASRLLQFF